MESLDIEPYSSILPVLLGSVIRPMTPDIIIGFVIIILLLFLSALMSGSEIAFFSLKPAQIRDLKPAESNSDKAILKLMEMPRRLLATILIANNFTNVSIVILSTFLTKSLFNFEEISPWLAFTIQVIVVTALIIFAGEILPKVYATQKNVYFARFVALPLKGLVTFLYPVSSVLMKSTMVIEKKMSKHAHNISMSELSDAIELTSDESTREEDTRILKGIVKFADIDVKEIMKARLDVVAVDTEMNYKELLKIIIESGYSRIPAYHETFDNIKGILYIKDLLPHLKSEDDLEWQSLLRDAFFVPENKKINDLLHEFQEKKIHLAIVVDEYGGTSGIVTLEDIIEEIVGEITDEHDLTTTEIIYSKLDDRNYIFEGKTSLNDFCKIIGIEDKIFEDIKGESDSLAGLILEQTGKIPEENESIEFENFIFLVISVDKRRIKRIKVTIKELPDENQTND